MTTRFDANDRGTAGGRPNSEQRATNVDGKGGAQSDQCDYSFIRLDEVLSAIPWYKHSGLVAGWQQEEWARRIHPDEKEWIQEDPSGRRRYLAEFYHKLRHRKPDCFVKLNHEINFKYYTELQDIGWIREDWTSYARPISDDMLFMRSGLANRWYKWRDEELSRKLGIPPDIKLVRERIAQSKAKRQEVAATLPISWQNKAFDYAAAVYRGEKNWTKSMRFLYNITRDRDTWTKFRDSWNTPKDRAPIPLSNPALWLYHPQPLYAFITGQKGELWPHKSLFERAFFEFQSWVKFCGGPNVAIVDQLPKSFFYRELPEWMRIAFKDYGPEKE